MNSTDLQDFSAADRAFAQTARARLQASESLNYVESARLAATRAQVRELLAAPRQSMPGWGWLAAPAVFAAVTFSVLRLDPIAPAQTVQSPSADALLALASDVNASTPAALEWQFDEAGPDFYNDLVFYQWLQSRSSSEPNA